MVRSQIVVLPAVEGEVPAGQEGAEEKAVRAASSPAARSELFRIRRGFIWSIRPCEPKAVDAVAPGPSAGKVAVEEVAVREPRGTMSEETVARDHQEGKGEREPVVKVGRPSEFYIRRRNWK